MLVGPRLPTSSRVQLAFEIKRLLRNDSLFLCTAPCSAVHLTLKPHARVFKKALSHQLQGQKYFIMDGFVPHKDPNVLITSVSCSDIELLQNCQDQTSHDRSSDAGKEAVI